VLAPARQAVDGHIGLAAAPGGFAAPGTGLAVAGASLVLGERTVAVTTLGDAASAAGVDPGRATGAYDTVTAWDATATLHVDPAAAALLAGWFSLGTAVLGRLGVDGITLWPEHFDVAATCEDRVNLGASPGDETHPLPYLYVGPWERREGPFWNESFGASLGYEDVDGPAAAEAFFREGLAQL
jgi:hypothetical protein